VFAALPTLLVLAGAGAVGWWGHHTGWTLPKFSELKGETAEPDDWCAEHNVPESACIECDDKLMPKGTPRGWCKEHGIPECVHCNPELAQLPKMPEVSDSDRERAKRMLAFETRTANNPNCQTHGRRIQFATARDADKAGIAVEPVWTSEAVEFVAATGELGYDQTKVTHLSARAPGSVWRVYRRLGEEVAEGDVLAFVDAAEVGKAKAELLLAFASLQAKVKTVAGLKESGAAVGFARLREAEAAVAEAEIRVGAVCQALTNLGLPVDEAQVRAMSAEQLKARLPLLGMPAKAAALLDPKTTTTNLLPVVTPTGGRLTSRDVVDGEVVDVARTLFEIVDTKSLWLTLDVRVEDSARVKVGQVVRYRPDGAAEDLTGKIAWRSSQADLKTRTVRVRADLADADRTLVANTFGSGRVVLRSEEHATAVPNEALQWEGCCQVVFVRDRNYLKSDFKVFHVRKVRAGAKGEKTTEVVGVLPGELVVTKGSGLLLTELLRGSLGAGCACHSKK
jgi:cobalt-zinc-cadmium efflux system membrane fusion protein